MSLLLFEYVQYRGRSISIPMKSSQKVNLPFPIESLIIPVQGSDCTTSVCLVFYNSDSNKRYVYMMQLTASGLELDTYIPDTSMMFVEFTYTPVMYHKSNHTSTFVNNPDMPTTVWKPMNVSRQVWIQADNSTDRLPGVSKSTNMSTITSDGNISAYALDLKHDTMTGRVKDLYGRGCAYLQSIRSHVVVVIIIGCILLFGIGSFILFQKRVSTLSRLLINRLKSYQKRNTSCSRQKYQHSLSYPLSIHSSSLKKHLTCLANSPRYSSYMNRDRNRQSAYATKRNRHFRVRHNNSILTDDPVRPATNTIIDMRRPYTDYNQSNSSYFSYLDSDSDVDSGLYSYSY